MAHAGGRPTKYKKEYAELMVKFFCIEATEKVKQTIITKSGIKEIEKKEGVSLPTIEGFATKIGVCAETIVEWVRVHPEFSAAYKKAKSAQKGILIENALAGRYQEGFSKFFAINCCGMVDKSERALSNPDGSLRNIVVTFVEPDDKS